MNRALRLALALSLCALACSSKGPLLPEERVGQIQPGLTTQVEIREWFGEPDAVEVDSLGAAEWDYVRHSRTRNRGRLGRWFLGPVSYFYHRFLLFPPSQEAVEPPLCETLHLSFGPDGVVSGFSHRGLQAGCAEGPTT